jgi:hypothetical protein
MKNKHMGAAALAALIVCAIVYAGPAGGTISGKVTYEGTPAKAKTIDMSKEPSCAKEHTTPVTTEGVVTGPNNSLENVVVYISAGIPDDAAPSTPAKFEQKGCQYIPHVLASRPMVNREWNKSQPAGSPPDIEKYDKPEFIPVKCNIHPWMSGQFAVMKNSHYAVSSGDGGFTLPNLPAGKYTVTAWHESYGDQSMDVTIAGSETKTVNFVFKAKPY